MDRSAYASLNAQEEGGHWWFTARRAILETLIATRIAPRSDARILEAGCGTGGNLAMLSRHGAVDALEYDAEARAIAAARGIGRIEAGMLPERIGFGQDRYDLIALLDVLEHVDQDRASLAALGARLAPGGRILLTVPAVPWLWSDHDVIHHHKRRYTRESLVAAARDAGLTVESVGYFNSLLFPLALAARTAARLLGRRGGHDAQPSPLVNGLFTRIFGWERHLLGRVHFPIGLSLYAILSA
jgi:SAM-dependent methyltransferase